MHTQLPRHASNDLTSVIQIHMYKIRKLISYCWYIFPHIHTIHMSNLKMCTCVGVLITGLVLFVLYWLSGLRGRLVIRGIVINHRTVDWDIQSKRIDIRSKPILVHRI